MSNELMYSRLALLKGKQNQSRTKLVGNLREKKNYNHQQTILGLAEIIRARRGREPR